MGFRTIEQLIDYCEMNAIAGPVARRGCSDEEIRELESLCAVTVPHSYRVYLSVMGHCASRLFAGDHTIATYAHVMEINADFAGYVAAKGIGSIAPDLPNDAIVIASRLFDDNWFIRCNNTDDSAVWCFNLEEPGEILLSSESFVEWLYSWAVHANGLIQTGWFQRDRRNS